MTITLRSDLEQKLSVAAQIEGESPEALVNRLLEEGLDPAFVRPKEIPDWVKKVKPIEPLPDGENPVEALVGLLHDDSETDEEFIAAWEEFRGKPQTGRYN